MKLFFDTYQMLLNIIKLSIQFFTLAYFKLYNPYLNQSTQRELQWKI